MPMATKFGMVGIYNEASFNKVTRPFYHVILQGHLKKEICYIPTTVRPMTTKPGKVEVYNEERPSIKSRDLERSCEKLCLLYFYFHKTNGN